MLFVFLFLLALSLSAKSARVLSNESGSSYVASRSSTTAPFIPAPPLGSSSFTSSQRPLPAIKVDPKGKVYTTQILKQQLANELGLPLRDLRIVDPSFPSQIQATFTSRPKAILFCIENIKVVVQHDEALIFSPYQPEVQEFVPALQQQIAQAASSDSSQGVTNFEHIVLEAALFVVCGNLLRRVRALSPAISSALDGLRAESRGLDVIITQVDTLLPLKNKLDELRKRVKEVKRAIMDILNNDDDMMMMNLQASSSSKSSSVKMSGSILSPKTSTFSLPIEVGSGNENNNNGIFNPSSNIDSTTMSIEMLFENYLNEVEWIASEVEEMIDEITNTEENVVLQLDLLRNRILRFELLLSISSFVVTCGALVTGLFGMNLLSHAETNGVFFYVVSAFIVSSMTGIFIAFTRYGKREKLF